jgi:hypothetical protein
MPGFSGQGKVYIGTALIGVGGIRQPGILTYIGNAPKFKINHEETTSQRNESFSGSRLPFRRLAQGRSGTVDIGFDEFTKDNMALALLGAVTQVTAGTAVVGYTFPTGAKIGSVLAVPGKNLTATALKDSAGTPIILSAANDYDLDAFAGSFTLKAIPGTQPYKADYTPGAFTKIAAMNQPTSDIYIRMDGINTDDGSRAIVDIFRARLSPISGWDAISNDYVDFEMQGSILADTSRLSAGADGQFYTITTP